MNDNLDFTDEEFDSAIDVSASAEDIKNTLSENETLSKKVCDSLDQNFLQIVNTLTPDHTDLSFENILDIFAFYFNNKENDKDLKSFISEMIGIKIKQKVLNKNFLFQIQYEDNGLVLSIDKNVEEKEYIYIFSTVLADILCHYTNGFNVKLYSAYVYQNQSKAKFSSHENMHEIEKNICKVLLALTTTKNDMGCIDSNHSVSSIFLKRQTLKHYEYDIAS